MATATKVLARTAAATSSTTLYTVPSATTTVVTDIVVTNTASASGSFTLSFNSVVFADTVTVAAKDSTIIQVKQVLTAAQTIAGLASSTTINFHISGVEIS
jgi:hypothetical protein